MKETTAIDQELCYFLFNAAAFFVRKFLTRFFRSLTMLHSPSSASQSQSVPTACPPARLHGECLMSARKWRTTRCLREVEVLASGREDRKHKFLTSILLRATTTTELRSSRNENKCYWLYMRGTARAWTDVTWTGSTSGDGERNRTRDETE